MKKLLLALLCLCPSLALAVSCPAGYTLTETVRIPPQASMSASTLTYQFYFPGHSTMATLANGGNAQSSTGLDVVWCDAASSGNVLPYELVPNTYSPTTGVGEWHIGVTLSKTAETIIYAMVGTGSPTDKSCGPSGTNNCSSTLWNNFKLVMHGGTSGSLSVTDSSANNTPTNHSATASAGKIQGAPTFTSAGTQYVDVGAANSLSTVSMLSWVKLNSLGSCAKIISNTGGSPANGYLLQQGITSNGLSCTGNGLYDWASANGGNYYQFIFPTAVTTGVWHMLGASQTGSTQAIYMDGFNVSSTGSHVGSGASVGTSTANLGINRTISASDYSDATIDEVRIYNGVLSSDYYAESYTNHNDPASFYSLTYRSPAHFYVSSAGSDSNNGTGTGTSWQTITKVNTYATSPGFIPGDEISFNGGDSFTGPLQIPANSTGSTAGGVIIDSYGTGNATITSGSGVVDGITLTNTEFMTVKNLTVTGAGWTGSGSSVTVLNGGTGINFLSTRTSGSQLRNNTVQGTTVSGYQWGITFDSRSSLTATGFLSPTIYNNVVSNNLTGGIFLQGYGVLTTSATLTQNNNVYIGYNTGKTIPGDPNSGTGGVHGAFITEAWCINAANGTGWTIERNKCFDIAGYGGAISGIGAGGSAAINLLDARNYTMNHNEIGGTKCSSAYDGAALDLDANVRNGEVAYNLTYNNSGPSVQFGTLSGQTTTNGRVHHNISYNDARGSNAGSNQGAFRFWHGTDGLQLYNNLCYVTPGTLGQASCVSFDNGAGGAAEVNMIIANNIFKTTSSVPVFYSSATPGTGYIVGNLYDSSGSSLVIANSSGGSPWSNISTISGWRAAGTNYEAITGINYGVVGSANLLNLAGFSPGSSGVGVPIEQVTNFNLTGSSAALGAGVLPWMLAVGPDGHDFHGNPFISSGLVDIGPSSYPQTSGGGSGSSGPGPIIVQ